MGACAAALALALGCAPAATAAPPSHRPGVVLVGDTSGHTKVLRVGRTQVAATVRRLRGHQDVRYAEPDYRLKAAAAPNDPSFGLQWGAPASSAVPAWDVTTGSRSIVIGEVDSGVDYRHPDLAANVWANPGGVNGCAAGTRGYSVLTSACNPMDDETTYGGHGTHVAGILGAVGNNGTGVAGMNWQTTILPVKWLDSSGNGYTSQIIAALEWLIRAKQAGVNIRVVNDSATFVGTAYSQALSDEIDKLGANDILFVTAAGNTGDNNDTTSVRRYPCGYNRPTEICVTASDSGDRLPSWANYGATTVDLAAPGDHVYSTLRNGTYGYVSGGSMASPQVAGAAALILARGYQSATALKTRLLNNVDKLASLSGRVRTGGRLNVCRALPGCVVPATPRTFGKTSVGGSSDTFAADRKRVNAYALAEAGTVSKLRIYLAPGSASGQQVLRGVLYADASGSPGARLGVSNELVFHSTDAAGWYDLTLPAPVGLAAGTYWIGVITGGTSGAAGFRYDSGATRKVNTNAYSSGATDPFGAVGSSDSEQMSLHAIYTPGAAAPPAPTTLGKTSVGGSTDTFAADRKRVNRYALSAAGKVGKLRIYLAPGSVSGQQNIRGVVYADSGGTPGALLGASNQLVFHSTDAAGWYDLALPSALSLAAGSYWIGVLTGGTSNVAGFRYDSVAGSRKVNANSYASGPANPFGAVTSSDGEQMSLYAILSPG